MNNRTKLKQIFKKIDTTNDLTFSSIFKKNLSKKILLYFFKEIEDEYSLLTYKPKSEKDLLSDLNVYNPHLKLRKLLQMFGFKIAVEKVGIREFRELIKHFGNNNWYRINKEFSALKFPLNECNILKSLKEEIIDFETLRLSKFFK